MTKRTLSERAIFLGIVGLTGLSACGGGASTVPDAKTPAREEGAGADKKSANVAKSAPGGGADSEAASGREPADDAAPGGGASQGQAADGPLPSKVGSLFAFVGRDAPIIVNVPKLDKVVAALDPDTRTALVKEFLDELTQKSPSGAALARGLLGAYDGAVAFSDPPRGATGEDAMENAACVAARFNDTKPVEALLADKNVERSGPARFTLKGESKASDPHGVWLADSGILLSCMTRKALSGALNVASGGAPSFLASPQFTPTRAEDVFVSLDMHSLLGSDAEPGSRMVASITTAGQKLGLDVRLSLYGPNYPAVGAIVDAAPQALVAKMPKGALGVVGMSLKRMAGMDLTSALKMLDAQTHGSFLKDVEEGTSQVGVSLADLNAALGDEIAVGAYRDPKYKIDFEKGGDTDHMAALIVVATKDEAAQKKLWGTFVAIAKKKPKEATVTGDTVEITGDPKSKDKSIVRVELRGGFVAIGVGEKAIVKGALAKLGKEGESLGKNAAFSEARGREKPNAHLLGFMDGAILRGFLDAKGSASKAPKVPAGPAFFTVVLGPTERGLDITLGGAGASEILGIGSSIAVAGMRGYIAKAKEAEPPAMKKGR